MSISSRRFSLLPLFAMVAVSAACSDATAPGASLSPEAPNFAVTFDPTTGTGFVGKGDVQLVYGWNNKALQEGAGNVEFRASSEVVTTWTCSKPHPTKPEDIVDLRNSTTTISGVLSSIARENSKGKDGAVTGFNLLGYDGSVDEVTVGDALGSCPADQSGFSYDEGSEQTEPGADNGLQVSINGTDWFDLE